MQISQVVHYTVKNLKEDEIEEWNHRIPDGDGKMAWGSAWGKEGGEGVQEV